jgi:hypothetical protein
MNALLIDDVSTAQWRLMAKRRDGRAGRGAGISAFETGFT